MTNSVVNKLKNIAVVISIAMFFSCTNDAKKVGDSLADKNLPIGEASNISHKHTDSGRIDVKMKAPLMLDFTNRKNHPYSEFPKGLTITTIDEKGDSITITGDYARNYQKTEVSEIKKNVIILNHTEKNRLETDQVFWDQKAHYFFTETKFAFYTAIDTIYGTGFEASEDLETWWVKNQTGVISIRE